MNKILRPKHNSPWKEQKIEVAGPCAPLKHHLQVARHHLRASANALNCITGTSSNLDWAKFQWQEIYKSAFSQSNFNLWGASQQFAQSTNPLQPYSAVPENILHYFHICLDLIIIKLKFLLSQCQALIFLAVKSENGCSFISVGRCYSSNLETIDN